MYYLRSSIRLELQQQESRNEIKNECILIMLVALELIFFTNKHIKLTLLLYVKLLTDRGI